MCLLLDAHCMNHIVSADSKISQRGVLFSATMDDDVADLLAVVAAGLPQNNEDLQAVVERAVDDDMAVDADLLMVAEQAMLGPRRHE